MSEKSDRILISVLHDQRRECEDEIAELKSLLKEAEKQMGFVSAWLPHPHDKTLLDMRDKIRNKLYKKEVAK